MIHWPTVDRCMHWPTCPMNTTLMCSFLGASGCVVGTLGTGASSSSSIVSWAISSVVACTSGPPSPPPGSSSFGSASFWSQGSSVLISVSPFSTGAVQPQNSTQHSGASYFIQANLVKNIQSSLVWHGSQPNTQVDINEYFFHFFLYCVFQAIFVSKDLDSYKLSWSVKIKSVTISKHRNLCPYIHFKYK